MKKIASILIDYGFEFNYENYGSGGEKIVTHNLCVTVTNQNGIIYFQDGGDTEEFNESEKNFDYITQKNRTTFNRRDDMRKLVEITSCEECPFFNFDDRFFPERWGEILV